ncbi:hypothetical protein SISSUDRAFT_1130375 [Sistotremastrum suecicum HHB10207 ss-3]|uniref:Uncharacterized protein n=1 Tax=Sistotremastrum suecicum HHB10207 ss-3 TaxID=1314776 RepID=A0A166BJM2_9AGAM|nr:hypothetical protein SISSUDRAFT_1130375 [Sistotremastrum suecicum HHB10207 ss-3]
MAEFGTQAPKVRSKVRARPRQSRDAGDNDDVDTRSSKRLDVGSHKRSPVSLSAASSGRNDRSCNQSVASTLPSKPAALDTPADANSQSLLSSLQGMRLSREADPEEMDRRISFFLPGDREIVYSLNSTRVLRDPPLFDHSALSDNPRIRDLTQPQLFYPPYAWAPLTPLLPIFEVKFFQSLHYHVNWPVQMYKGHVGLRADLIVEWEFVELVVIKCVRLLLDHCSKLPERDPRRMITRDLIRPKTPKSLGYTRAHATELIAQRCIHLSYMAFRMWLGFFYLMIRLLSENISESQVVFPKWFYVLRDAGIPSSYLSDFYQASVFAVGSGRVGAVINVEHMLSEEISQITQIYIDALIPLYYRWPEQLSRPEILGKYPILRTLIPSKSLFGQAPIQSKEFRNTVSTRVRRGYDERGAPEFVRHIESLKLIKAQLERAPRGDEKHRSWETRARLMKEKDGNFCFALSTVFEWVRTGGDGPYVQGHALHRNIKQYVWAQYPKHHRFYDPITDQWHLCMGYNDTSESTLLHDTKHRIGEWSVDGVRDVIIDAEADHPNDELHQPGLDVDYSNAKWVAEEPGHDEPVTQDGDLSCSTPTTDQASLIRTLIERYGFIQAQSISVASEDEWQNLMQNFGYRHDGGLPPPGSQRMVDFVNALKEPSYPDHSHDLIDLFTESENHRLRATTREFSISMFQGCMRGAPKNGVPHNSRSAMAKKSDANISGDIPPATSSATDGTSSAGSEEPSYDVYRISYPNDKTPYDLVVFKATDAVFVYRRHHKSVFSAVMGLLEHGIPFATVIGKGMAPPREPLPTTSAPFYVLENHSEAMQLRTEDVKFVPEDYENYKAHCARLLSRPGGRAALSHGGLIWRIAKQYIGAESVLNGPSTDATVYGLCWGFHVKSSSYEGQVFDDLLTFDVASALCGVVNCFSYKISTGPCLIKRSYFPPPNTWYMGRNRLNVGHWTEGNEAWFQKLDYEYRQGLVQPKTAQEWRKELRAGAVKQHVAHKGMEHICHKFIQSFGEGTETEENPVEKN